MKRERVFKPYNYCAVCGRSMDEQIPYYPYGFTDVPYCENCAKQIIRSRDQKRANARKDESVRNIAERKAKDEKVETIAESYQVSPTFIRTLLKCTEK